MRTKILTMLTKREDIWTTGRLGEITATGQIVLPETLRPRILDLAHYSKFAGHPGQTRMYRHLRGTYYWPQMAADFYKTVRMCNACAKNRVKLRKRTHTLRLFPARSPLEALSIDIHGPLTKTKKGYRFLLVFTDRFTKLTQVIPLRRIDSYTVFDTIGGPFRASVQLLWVGLVMWDGRTFEGFLGLWDGRTQC